MRNIIIIIVITVIAASPTYAEIYTGGDWIGIFPVNEDDALPYKFGGPTSTKWTNCTALGSIPQSPTVSGSCSFSAPANPGLYHFRMEANALPTPIAISNPFWVSFSMAANAICQNGLPTINVTWPYIYGLEPGGLTPNQNDYFSLFRDGAATPLATIRVNNPLGNSYTDIVGENETHSYSVTANSCYNCNDTAFSGIAISLPSTNTPSATAPTAVACAAWIQTTGGDVHTNTQIITPGGP